MARHDDGLSGYGAVQGDHRGVHQALVRWAIWVRHSTPQGRCFSAEGNWRSPQCWHEKPTPVVIYPNESYAVERIVTRLPRLAATHLKLWYVLRRPPGEIRRKLNLTADELVAHLHTAREYVASGLTRGHDRP
jgi:DNA-directed RNA polymerase specialized sigma24 family protein